jgi:hypothetical protein
VELLLFCVLAKKSDKATVRTIQYRYVHYGATEKNRKCCTKLQFNDPYNHLLCYPAAEAVDMESHVTYSVVVQFNDSYNQPLCYPAAKAVDMESQVYRSINDSISGRWYLLPRPDCQSHTAAERYMVPSLRDTS